jgi:midasin
LSIILQRQVTVVNCHASTETSDILGGFRPVRGRQIIVQEMIDKSVALVQEWSDSSFDVNAIAPQFILDYAKLKHPDIPHDAPKQVVEFIREIGNHYRSSNGSSTESSMIDNEKLSSKKRRKLSNGIISDHPKLIVSAHYQRVENICREIDDLYQKYSALFEWADGPLVCSMKNGGFLLLDEMSLAEDAVLERLNSVLEPSRTLTLAEKGGKGSTCAHDLANTSQTSSSEIRAQEEFRIFATMNPGGDFGKRELSPALRSRFTEIWVPSVSSRSDIGLVLERSFSSAIEHYAMQEASIVSAMPEIVQMMLDYFDWFNIEVCDNPSSFCNDFKLSLRDMLSWAKFIAEVVLKNKVSPYSAYVHGASLMHLDGLGLGTGVSNHDAAVTRNTAKAFLLNQIASQGAVDLTGFQDELHRINEFMIATEDRFGIDPFTISMGNEQVPTSMDFNFRAPTTGLNLRRVLRGMQISKPILLEGSPGVGKTR